MVIIAPAIMATTTVKVIPQPRTSDQPGKASPSISVYFTHENTMMNCNSEHKHDVKLLFLFVCIFYLVVLSCNVAVYILALHEKTGEVRNKLACATTLDR